MTLRRTLAGPYCWACLLLAIVAAPSLVDAQEKSCVHSPHGLPGWWSATAIDLIDYADSARCYDEDSRNISIPSPDGKTELRLYGDSIRFVYRKASGPTLHIHHFATVGYPAEISWAPDSNAFYITESNGSIRGFQATIYYGQERRLRELPDISPVIWSAINDHHQCVEIGHDKIKYVVDANIAGLRWVENSSRLLLIAEIPVDTPCPRGYFAGYVIALPERTIVARYSPSELMKLYPESIGRRLRGDYQDLSVRERDTAP
jgi:hypothetical protein